MATWQGDVSPESWLNTASSSVHALTLYENALLIGNSNSVCPEECVNPLNKTSSFTTYTKEQFLEKEQVKLKELFQELDKKGAKVMLSNSDTEFIKRLYEGYNLSFVKANRMINCDATKRGKINEVVITNYPIEKQKNLN